MKWNWILEAKKICSRERFIDRPSNGGSLSAVIVYPDRYFTGMSNLGFQSVWHVLNGVLSISCERAFYPDKKYVDFFRKNKNLRSLETQKPLQEFDLICFSISYEMNYPLVADILNMTPIPLFSEERKEKDPLVILGGAVSYLNAEPIADFIDAVFMGRAEDVWPYALKAFETGLSRGEILRELSSMKNIYVPSMHTRAEKQMEPYSSSRFFSSSILTADTEFSDMLLTEIMRGCPFMCKFCAVSNCFGKCVFRPFEDIVSTLRPLKGIVEKVGLIGGSINAHPEFYKILEYLRREGFKVGFSSLRADRLTPELLDFIKQEGGGSLTLAPESANEKLRFFIGKKISDESFFHSIEMAFRSGIRKLRLYFMIGLPGESLDDAALLSETLKKIKTLKFSESVRITVSISQFIPKPFTPLERFEQTDESEILKRLELIKKTSPSGFKITYETPSAAAIQGILARGDRKLSVMTSDRELGFSYGKWKRAANKHGIDLDFYLRGKEDGEPLPWR